MNTCFVIEKRSVHRQLLKNGLIQKTDPIDFMGSVFDTLEERSPFFRHPDGKWYNAGDETAFTEIELPNVPKSRFIGADYNKYKDLALTRRTENDTKYIYFVICGKYNVPYLVDLVAALYHADYVKAKKENCFVQLYDMEYRAVLTAPTNLMHMLEEYDHLFDEVPEVNPLRRLCYQARMSLKEFSDHFGIKYRTVQNWAGNVNEMPEWALPLFETKLMADKRI